MRAIGVFLGRVSRIAFVAYLLALIVTGLLALIFLVWFAVWPGPVVLIFMIGFVAAFGGVLSVPFIVGPKLTPGGK